MSNQYFRFKQFTVHQDQCAMKVSTDACIQGAWTPVLENVKHVLDIGTGTGLLSLMLAQRNEGILIDAIETDKQAAEQAQENINASHWKHRIQLIHGDVRHHHFTKQYDLIICNPPFFSNSLLGPQHQRNKARHSISLHQNDLVKLMEELLTATGYASVLLPLAESKEWEEKLEVGNWSVSKKLSIQPKPNATVNRMITLCSKEKTDNAGNSSLIIYQDEKEYTAEFKALMQPFYLYL